MNNIEGISHEETIAVLKDSMENPNEYLCNLISQKLKNGPLDYTVNDFIYYWFNEIKPESQLSRDYSGDETSSQSALFYESEVENKKKFIQQILDKIQK